MTIEEKKELIKLRKIPFEDKKFTRFIKEKKVFMPFIREINANNDLNILYQLETLRNNTFKERFVKYQGYILDGIYERYSEGINWETIAAEWQNERNKG